ncbi:PAS domain-containing protein [Flavobacteriaceae bacterium D16]|nr:PAS domain-containing protein [Flavobacteriaceae bacterium D16]
MEAITNKFTIRQSPFSVAVLDSNGNILNYSNRFAEAIDEQKDLTGQNYFTIVPHVPHAFKKINKDNFGEELTITEVSRFIPLDGKPQWFEWKLSQWTGNEGQYGGIMIYFDEVTESHRDKELIARAMDVARIGGWEVDLVNNTIYWSKVTKEIHEVPQDYVPDLEKGINFYKEGEDRDMITALVSEAIANGTPWDTELRIITLKGNEVWVHAKGEAELVNGKCVRLLGTFQDIDDRKRMELKNHVVSERLAIATQAANIGIWDLDLVKNKLIWSDEMYAIYGLDKSDFSGTNEAFEAALHPEDRIMVQEEGARLAMEGALEFDTEFRVIWPNGQVRIIRSMGHIERDEDGNTLKMVGANWDVTESRDAEKRLKDLLSITTEQNESLMNFAHIVSHNLRSHSSNLSMLTTFLDTENEKGERERLMKMLLEASESLDETVGHLTEVVQVKAEASDKIKNINLFNVLTAVKKNLSLMLEEEGAVCKIDVDKNINIKAIPAYLDSIFLNLFTNSLKYKSTDRKLELKIKARNLGNKVLVCFQDNGQGIDLERHGNKIFGMYKTFHKHKDAKGIGLFITKNQIEAMQGKIEVESAVNEGTTFHLTFKKP